MNLPNKLTVARVILIPFFVFFLLNDSMNPYFKWVALAIFIVASLTDLLDGKIARKYNLVTDFGKFMDPLADDSHSPVSPAPPEYLDKAVDGCSCQKNRGVFL